MVPSTGMRDGIAVVIVFACLVALLACVGLYAAVTGWADNRADLEQQRIWAETQAQIETARIEAQKRLDLYSHREYMAAMREDNFQQRLLLAASLFQDDTWFSILVGAVLGVVGAVVAIFAINRWTPQILK